MTAWHLFLITLVAWGPVITIIHLYSKRYINCGKIYVDQDERQLFCYGVNGETKVLHTQEEAVQWLMNIAKPPIARARITLLDKKPKVENDRNNSRVTSPA